MPDRYGFNLLGDSARCIDCPAGGPIWRWPERKRSRHARTHQTQSSTGLRRRPNLLAAPPTDSSEEKEAITMAHEAPRKGEPAKQVAIDVLRQAGEPLHAKEIAKRVLASGRCAGLKGRTPEATITAMLAVGSKPGGPFARVDKGTYTLADAPSAAAQPAQPPKPAATKAPTHTREPAQAQKPKSAAPKRQTAKRSR
jgi:hypothetical protein